MNGDTVSYRIVSYRMDIIILIYFGSGQWTLLALPLISRLLPCCDADE